MKHNTPNKTKTKTNKNSYIGHSENQGHLNMYYMLYSTICISVKFPKCSNHTVIILRECPFS